MPERSIMPGKVLPNTISSELAKNQKIKTVTASPGSRCANTNSKNSGSAIRVLTPFNVHYKERFIMTMFFKKKFIKMLAILLAPFSCLTLVIVLNMLNPMALAFLIDFDVENKTDELIFVTPIGSKAPNGARHQLPYSISSSFYFQIPSEIDYPIEAGVLKRFIYDYDDIQFSEILVRRAEERYRVLSIPPKLQSDGFYPPKNNQIEIKKIDALPFAKKQHLLALKENRMTTWTIEILAAIGLLSPIFFVIASQMKS
ncbi:hypothetical protein [Gimesia fumaroli]|uniref:Uncharacterized protein n=1 Tax=Gimesia fumaroli TaxID=2527976 RepID=A0A518IJ02_9PLAN|nr:hypothetical protein [Gimesia fumaroli]QDV53064.1 hypothetical protein Enr17x_51350 [Gimesia fumaroli]